MGVKDLIDQHSQRWKSDLIVNLFSPNEASTILDIPIGHFDSIDSLVWHFNALGKYSVKLGYIEYFKISSFYFLQPLLHYTLSLRFGTRFGPLGGHKKFAAFGGKFVGILPWPLERIFFRESAPLRRLAQFVLKKWNQSSTSYLDVSGQGKFGKALSASCVIPLRDIVSHPSRD